MGFNNIYRGKRVLITGHTGFKGSWLALWLRQLGAEVLGYSRDIPSEPNHWTLLQLPIKSVMGDICDAPKLTATMAEFKPDIVFHLAAQALVRQSYAEPVDTFATNVLGTVHVLEACRQTPSVKAIVNVTSDKCYDNDESHQAYTETHPMGGNDPYSASKGCAELVGQAYRYSFFKDSSTLLADARAGNVIGGGDWAKDRLIPDLMQAASTGQTVAIRNPHSTRPWQHVLEPVSGYLHLGWKLLAGERAFADNWNFGPPDEAALTVQQVINHVQEHWPAFTYTVQPSAEPYHEAKFLKLDSTKARANLHWSNVWDKQTTFAKTVQWYKTYYETSAIISSVQLEEYIVAAKQLKVAWAV